jgi:hypothetical protein
VMPACAVQAKLRNQRIDHRLTLTPEHGQRRTIGRRGQLVDQVALGRHVEQNAFLVGR